MEESVESRSDIDTACALNKPEVHYRLRNTVGKYCLAAFLHIRQIHEQRCQTLPSVHSVHLVMEVVKMRPVLLTGLHMTTVGLIVIYPYHSQGRTIGTAP